MFSLNNLYKVLLLLICLSSGYPLNEASAQIFRITGLQDLNAGTWSGAAGDVDVIDGTICVYKTPPNRNYRVTATGTGAGGSFVATSGANTLTYQVAWKGSSGAGGAFTNLTAGTSQRFNNAASNTLGCGGSYNAAMRIRFLNTALSVAQPGTYSDTVTIVISP